MFLLIPLFWFQDWNDRRIKKKYYRENRALSTKLARSFLDIKVVCFCGGTMQAEGDMLKCPSCLHEANGHELFDEVCIVGPFKGYEVRFNSPTPTLVHVATVT